MATGRPMGPGKKSTPSKEKAPEEKYICPHCGRTLKKSEFYVSSDPAVIIGVAFPCKDCARNISRRYDPKTKQYAECTTESVKAALEYLDKPYIQDLWDSSFNEVHDPSLKQPKKSVWDAYIKNVQMYQYKSMRWRDGDLLKTKEDNEIHSETPTLPQNPEVLEECEKNRKDVIRLIGYDPFEKEAEEDQPLLYAQLIGYIDMNGDNEDMTRVLDSIEIVRGYLQLQKLNDMSAKAFSNLSKTGNSGEIKNYMDTKKKVADVISQLAEQSCISMKHNKNSSKGENTFAGKIKKLKELNLREAELNAFDIGTCEGMKQVADISNASIIKQLHLDESDYTEMLAQQREMIIKLQEQADTKTEEARILLRENIDLKKFIEENGIDISQYMSNDTILYQE